MTYWCWYIWSHVAAEGLFVQPLLHGGLKQTLAGIKPINICVGMVLQLKDNRLYENVYIGIGMSKESLSVKQLRNKKEVYGVFIKTI